MKRKYRIVKRTTADSNNSWYVQYRDFIFWQNAEINVFGEPVEYFSEEDAIDALKHLLENYLNSVVVKTECTYYSLDCIKDEFQELNRTH